MDEKKLRLALAIVAGRAQLDGSDWDTLGYDPYRFQGLGTPTSYEIREKAIEIIIAAIKEAHARATEAEMNPPPHGFEEHQEGVKND
jgi:hypothetical protein